jgi:hypothetical protein
MLVPWGSGAKFGNAMDFMSVVWLSIIGVWEWKNLDEICPNFAFCPTNQIPLLTSELKMFRHIALFS